MKAFFIWLWNLIFGKKKEEKQPVVNKPVECVHQWGIVYMKDLPCSAPMPYHICTKCGLDELCENCIVKVNN